MALTFDRNFGLRVVSALAALPLVFLPLYFGGIWFFLFVCLGSFLVHRELFRLVGFTENLAMSMGLLTLFLVTVATNSLSLANPESSITLFWVFGLSMAGMLFSAGSLFLTEKSPKIAWWICAVLYIAMIASSILWLSYISKMLVVWLLFSVWASDVGGYFAGRMIGGPKLAPSVSPKKTWAGAIGGMVLAAAIGYAISMIADWWNPVIAAIASVAVAVFSQLGDLYESALKRRFDVKDSGSLMPGHGGLLDRVDGLAIAAGAVALYETYSRLGG